MEHPRTPGNGITGARNSLIGDVARPTEAIPSVQRRLTPAMRPDPSVVPRLQRAAAHLHRLGPRAISEFLTEMAGRTGDTAAILGTLAEYERLSPAKLRVTGGDRFPARVLVEVP